MRNQFLIDLLEPRRLLSAGDIDSSFGVNGRATLDFTVPADDFPSSVVVLPDGKFLVGHNSFASASNDVGAFSRHLANGQLDTTFGGGTGKVRLGDSWGTNGIEDMFVRTNGEIIAMGRGGTGLAAVRAFDADGNVLPTSSFNFPSSGISTTRIGLLPLTGGGGLLLTGTAVHKFKANGTLDTTFGSAGTFTFPTTSNVRFGGTGFALDSTGAIYISGYNLTTTTGVRQPAIAKLTSNGAFRIRMGHQRRAHLLDPLHRQRRADVHRRRQLQPPDRRRHRHGHHRSRARRAAHHRRRARLNIQQHRRAIFRPARELGFVVSRSSRSIRTGGSSLPRLTS